MCKNTDRLQTWAYCVFKEWLENQQSSDLDEQVTLYEESHLYSEDAEKVCAMLYTLIAKERQQNGSPYSPKSLLQLVSNLQSYALKIDAQSCRFMEERRVSSISKSFSAKELVCRRNKPELWQVKKKIYFGKQVKWVYIVRVHFWMLSFLLLQVLSERGLGAQGNKNEPVPLQRCRRPIWWNSNSSLFKSRKHWTF